MMGLALRNVTLTLLCDGKPLFTEQGEALFTHFGLSGPLVLSASTYIEDITKHRYICEFDLKPALDEKTLYDRLTRDFAEQGSHSAGRTGQAAAHSMRPVAVEKWGVDPATKAAQITREQKQALVDLCKHWQVPVSALGDKEHAVITAGGVDVREVDPKTMARSSARGCTLPVRSLMWTPAPAGTTCKSLGQPRRRRCGRGNSQACPVGEGGSAGPDEGRLTVAAR